MPQSKKLLHVFPNFAPGGAEIRTTKLINHFGRTFHHVIVSLSGTTTASQRIHAGIDVEYVPCQGVSNPLVMIRKLLRIIRSVEPHLVLSYNWGAVDAVVAARLYGRCPLIHTEDGFSTDELQNQKRRRVLYRRMALRRAFRLVAISERLHSIIVDTWRFPERQVAYIPNGIEIDHFRHAAPREGSGDFTIGTVANLVPVKNQGLLIDLFARLAAKIPARLLIAGDGPERSVLEHRAAATGFGHRIEFLGRLSDPRSAYERMDVFVLTSKTEQMPLSVLEAMAHGLPVVSTAVGDVPRMVSSENRPLISDCAEQLLQHLRTLALHAELRSFVGLANRERCVSAYSIDRMFTKYEELYSAAIGG